MTPAALRLAPSSRLPALKEIPTLSTQRLFEALEGLSAIYCPLSASIALKLSPSGKRTFPNPSNGVVDSGYASGTEEDVAEDHVLKGSLALLRTDSFERQFAERWLTRFLAQAETLPCLDSEELLDRALQLASCVLESFVAPTDDWVEDESPHDFGREFSFQLATDSHTRQPINVRLNDGLAGTNPDDPHDVGLQSWGASIVFSKLICEKPHEFGITAFNRAAESPRIIELGAGTGLVSLVLGAALPHLGLKGATVIATDYHPAVLENLQSNISTNFDTTGQAQIQMCVLDWSAPVLDPPLDKPADILVATDVVYAADHALWLRDCAAKLLKPNGIFWLMITVRKNGRFEGVDQTVESVFANKGHRIDQQRFLSILGVREIEKIRGTGRGDESGYKLFKIGWGNNDR